MGNCSVLLPYDNRKIFTWRLRVAPAAGLMEVQGTEGRLTLFILWKELAGRGICTARTETVLKSAASPCIGISSYTHAFTKRTAICVGKGRFEPSSFSEHTMALLMSAVVANTSFLKIIKYSI